MWTKSRRVESFWIHAVSRKYDVLRLTESGPLGVVRMRFSALTLGLVGGCPSGQFRAGNNRGPYPLTRSGPRIDANPYWHSYLFDARNHNSVQQHAIFSFGDLQCVLTRR
jgi:hypothetical protein